METLNQIAAQLGIDQTFFYLFILVVALHALLSAAYLKPYQKLLASRREKTEGMKKLAQKLSEQAEEKLTQYKVRLKEINEKAKHEIREREELGRKEESKIVGEASAKAKGYLQKSQEELDAERKAALGELSGEISGLATEIATKVMGRPAGTR